MCISNALCETVLVLPLSVKCRVSVLEQQDGAAMCRPELGLCGAQILLTKGFTDYWLTESMNTSVPADKNN